MPSGNFNNSIGPRMNWNWLEDEANIACLCLRIVQPREIANPVSPLTTEFVRSILLACLFVCSMVASLSFILFSIFPYHFLLSNSISCSPNQFLMCNSYYFLAQGFDISKCRESFHEKNMELIGSLSLICCGLLYYKCCKPNKPHDPLELCLSFQEHVFTYLTVLWSISKVFP